MRKIAVLVIVAMVFEPYGILAVMAVVAALADCRVQFELSNRDAIHFGCIIRNGIGRDGSCCGIGLLSCAVSTHQSQRHPFWLYHMKHSE